MELLEIIKLIRTQKPALVQHALTVWEKDHPNQPEPLIETIKFADAALIGPALKLAARYHPVACAPFITQLFTNTDSKVRRLAVQAINEKMTATCQEALIDLLAKETDVFVLASAMNAAAKLHLDVVHLKPCLKHTDIRVRANAVRAAAVCSPQQIQEMLEPMLQDKALRVQNEALKSLAQFIPEDELEKLVYKRLQSENASTRAATAFITGELPLSMRLVFLMEALKDKDARVVSNAARSLCRIHDPLGVEAVVATYLHTAEQHLANTLLRQLKPEDRGIIVEQAEKIGKPGRISATQLSRIVAAAEFFSDWEPLLPWLMAAVDRDESEVRLQALRVVYLRLDFFRSNIERMLEKAQLSGNSPEIAMAHFIRWKSGITSELEKLKLMLFSGRKDDIAAVSDLLKTENSILARRLLEEASKRGIYIADTANTLPEKPIKLPEN
ncbi:MAG: HEAT repeat domain-containing protein [Candidatus Riflebacteria bacterium]|nr:HEAT repeat domain-containing protein [Candidatus Riflebacteria bacterium]